ncbi:peptidoglycan-binding domain-containing protein [Thalassovita sp.]|uniref:peptidoglycan-binding domain-containing protein n=1 Tax=Thalassovita sp. TaxID=1979401 RepID=UPI002B26DEA0|nr:peptidoglycan-binding domain-containing protein [Thalassovita sp.]
MEQYPESDLAVGIILQDTIDGVDLSLFSQQLENSAVESSGQNSDTQIFKVGETPAVPDPDDCIAAALDEPADQQLLIGVNLGPDGRVSGIPELVAPENPNSSARKLFLSAVGAIDRCAPYPVNQTGSRFEVKVSKDGITISTDLARTLRSETAVQPSTETAVAEASVSNTNQITSSHGAPPNSTQLSPATSATESDMALDKQAIRDIQARLLVLGYDPNGIDGLIGRGVRSAVKKWQVSRDINANGYLNEEQLAALKAQSQPGLKIWLSDPENEQTYNPPPPMPIGPYNISGAWRFTTSCNSKSRLGRMKITGSLSIRYSRGNLYSGRARNSQGMNGRFSGKLIGRRMTGEINWGLLVGRVQFRGTFADQKLVMSGHDTNGCSFYAAKSR